MKATKAEKQKIARAVKAAKKETEIKITKKLLAADKAEMARAVKAAKIKAERETGKKLLEANKKKIAGALKAGRKRISGLMKFNNLRLRKKIRENNKATIRAVTGIKPRRRKLAIMRERSETRPQRLKRVYMNIYTLRDRILYGIASGEYKFKWASVAKQTGMREGDRRKILSLLGGKGKGYTVEGLAHHIWEENGGSYGRGPDDAAIRDKIIDVLQTVSSPAEALDKLDHGCPF